MVGIILSYAVQISVNMRANCAPVRPVGCVIGRSLRLFYISETGVAEKRTPPNLASGLEKNYGRKNLQQKKYERKRNKCRKDSMEKIWQ